MSENTNWVQVHEALRSGYRMHVEKAPNGWNWEVRIAGAQRVAEYGISDTRRAAMSECEQAVWRQLTRAQKVYP